MKGIYVLLIAGLIGGAYYIGTLKDTQQEVQIKPAVDYSSDKLNDTSIAEEPKVNIKKREIQPVTRVTSVEEATIKLFEESAPSVAFITTSTLRKDYWTRDVTEIPSGSGSGFIWDYDGHIVTNFHVIKDASKAVVTLADQSSYEAELVGYEPRKDIAVLKIDAPLSVLRPIPVGTSSDLKVGQSVYAIGNPFGLDQSLTTGIISALGREIQSQARIPIRDVIQTDAAINPGNSGGPLLDSSGRLIGVNTAIYSPSGAYAGIGFSVPADVVNWVVPDIIKYGEVRRPILGVELVNDQLREREQASGPIIMNVTPGGAAQQAGIRGMSRDAFGRNQQGDVILAINGQKVESNLDLIFELEKYTPGQEITVTYQRGNKEYDIDLRLGSSKDQ
ncbi:MAG: PDZ domain-containing protein [Saprospiraceae bacterium]|nr:PDZ domain-containing protein [Saprospiraceae bacterium]